MKCSGARRPHLHAFLTAVYPHFDIVIWSANSIKWMNVKMKALHVLDNDHFKVAFMLDYRSMLTVTTPKYGAALGAASVLLCSRRRTSSLARSADSGSHAHGRHAALPVRRTDVSSVAERAGRCRRLRLQAARADLAQVRPRLQRGQHHHAR